MFKKRIRRNWFVPKGEELTELDKKVLSFQNRGCLVPSRDLIKTPEQVEGIRRSGVVNTGVLDLVAQEIHEGMTTLEIDQLVYDYTVGHGAIPAPLNYEGFVDVCLNKPLADATFYSRTGNILILTFCLILLFLGSISRK